jgi:NSS family neurotransmitter:Na+ symporter
MKSRETFASRWGIIFAGIGMAVGTGNIWRFPRIVSQHGGGAFLIAWLIFLLLWSIPILTIELSFGKKTRLGVIGAFNKIGGKKLTWMGSTVAFIGAAIMFYYSVVTGWCIKYFFATIFQNVIQKDSTVFWRAFTSSWQPVIFHGLAIGIGVLIVFSGVVKGIERANKFLIPSLFFLLIVASIRAMTLPNALQGLNYIFAPNLSQFADYKMWLNALTQSAWSTGAGWGLLLTYAVYSHRKENPLLTASTIGFGNNIASLLAACAVIPTVFSVFSTQEYTQQKVMEVMQADNQGLTFIWIPRLFGNIPGGTFFLALFFLALTFAAFSSLIAMLELVTRIFMDTGMNRKKAVVYVGLIGFVLGLPSAISLGFFNNQDWVWGLGLILSGAFFTYVVIMFGPKKFRKEIISMPEEGIKVGRWFEVVVWIFLPLQFLATILWWFWQSYSADPQNWLKINSSSSVGTVLFQWGVAIILFILLNKIIYKRLGQKTNDA